jgi:phasin family protein
VIHLRGKPDGLRILNIPITRSGTLTSKVVVVMPVQGVCRARHIMLPMGQRRSKMNIEHAVEHLVAASRAELQEVQNRSLQSHDRLEDLIRTNLAFCRACLDEATGCAHAILSSADALAVMNLQGSLYQALTVKSAVYTQQIVSLTHRTRSELLDAFQVECVEAEKIFSGAMEKIIQNAPIGTENTAMDLQQELKALKNLIE